MKIYQENKTKKSWVIKLEQFECIVHLIAVDENTGDDIVTLITFRQDGEIRRIHNAESVLAKLGYDPYQHNNSFDESGRLVIE